MRIGYENGIIEDQLLASASITLNFPPSNMLIDGMDTKYKSLANGSLLITMRHFDFPQEIFWGSEAKVVSSDIDTNDDFGVSIDTYGDYMIVGASGESSSKGAAYVFHRTGIDTWDTGTKLVASDGSASDQFGTSVSITEDYCIVGSPNDNPFGSDSGSAHIFQRTGTNSWSVGFKIVQAFGQIDDLFGGSVSISGDYAVIGAVGQDDGGSLAGAAYAFRRTSDNVWDSQVKLVASDAQAGDLFGDSVSISGDYIAVGAPAEDFGGGDPLPSAGAVYIYNRTGTNIWDTGVKRVANDAQSGDQFGFSVSISSSYMISGAVNESGGGGDPILQAGAAYIYYRTDTNTWDTGTKIVASDAFDLDHFGTAVGMSMGENFAIVGAPTKNSSAGASYIFQRTDTNTWDSGTKIVSSDTASLDQFGGAVSIFEDHAVVGAYDKDSEGASYSFNNNVINSPDSINASMCCINAHNMIEGDTVVLNGYASKYSPTPSVTYSFTLQEYGMAVIFDEADYFWEIELTVANPVEIGGLFLGTHLITPAYEIGAETLWRTTDINTLSGSGQLSGDEGYYYRTAKYLMPWFTVDESDEWLAFFKSAGARQQFYLLQYPDRQDIAPLFYCYLTSKIFPLAEHEGNRNIYKNIPLSIREVF